MKIIAFTDLDATLLDRETYSWEPAGEALDALRSVQASVVMVSSKTLAEMEPLHRALGFDDPFIVENGGGIAAREGCPTSMDLLRSERLPAPVEIGNLIVFSMGSNYPELVRALALISTQLNLELIGFSSMSDEEVASLTGLNPEDAARARERMFDEPFIVPTEAKGRELEIVTAAGSRGLTAVQGGRFWHLFGHPGKGGAVSVIIESYRSLHREAVTIGLGDSPNDFPFLGVVDIPVLVGWADRADPLPASIAGARRTAKEGPEGWKQAILEILPLIFRP